MSLTQGALLTICQGGEVVNPNIQVSSLHKRDLNEKESKVLNDFADGKNIFSEIKHWGKNYGFFGSLEVHRSNSPRQISEIN